MASKWGIGQWNKNQEHLHKTLQMIHVHSFPVPKNYIWKKFKKREKRKEKIKTCIHPPKKKTENVYVGVRDRRFNRGRRFCRKPCKYGFLIVPEFRIFIQWFAVIFFQFGQWCYKSARPITSFIGVNPIRIRIISPEGKPVDWLEEKHDHKKPCEITGPRQAAFHRQN